MDPHDDNDFDRLDPLAPRPDDPRIGRWLRLSPRGRPGPGGPLAAVLMTLLAVMTALVCVWAAMRW